jgi:hypothetical protein
MIPAFKPGDLRLLLALELGSFYVEHSHITSPEQKRIAKSIRIRIAPKIPHFKSEVMKEFKGMVLEMRAEGVKALDTAAEEKIELDFPPSSV